jgi:hypothetical protein
VPLVSGYHFLGAIDHEHINRQGLSFDGKSELFPERGEKNLPELKVNAVFICGSGFLNLSCSSLPFLSKIRPGKEPP